jgi:hypothetical protein
MANNADLKTIKNGFLRVFVNQTELGILSTDDFVLEDQGTLREAMTQETGDAPVKMYTGGASIKGSLTLQAINKLIQARLWPQHVYSGLSQTDTDAGQVKIVGAAGRTIKPFVLTAYLIHDNGDGVPFGSDNLNPVAFQAKRVAASPMKLAIGGSDAAKQEVEFTCMPDLDDADKSPGVWGFVTLPNPEIFYVGVTNGGSGYTSAPTVSIAWTGKTGVTATAVVVSNVVTKVTITNQGTGTPTGNPTITFSGGAGTGAAATAFVG